MIPAEERFWVNVQGGDVSTCWTWTAYRSRDGYGRFMAWVDGSRKPRPAHRWSYEQLVGEVPAGLDLDHLCRTRACVNPWHLEPVTRSINLLRGSSVNREKQECVNGHLFTSDNTYSDPGTTRRSCRTCRQAAVQRFARRHAT